MTMDASDARMIADELSRALRGQSGKLGGDIDPKDVEKLTKYLEELGKTAERGKVSLGALTKEMITGKRKYIDLSNTIDELDEQIEKFGDNVNKNSDEVYRGLITKREELKAIRGNAMAMQGAVAGVKLASSTLGQVVSTIARGAATVVRDITSGADVFTTVADAMDVSLDVNNQVNQGLASAGKAAGAGLMQFGGAATAAGALIWGVAEVFSLYSEYQTETIKFYNRFVLTEGSKLINAFQQASTSGAMFANGMTGISMVSSHAGLTIKQFSDAVARNRETLAKSGLGVGEASEQMARSIAYGGVTARRELLNLGYTIEEQADLYAETMADMRRANDPRIRDEAAVHQATMQYAENLRVISAITGEDAKKKMDESRALAAQAAFRIKLQELEKTQPGITQKVLEAMSTMSPTMQKAIQQQIGLGTVVDQSANVLMSMSDGFRQGVQGTVDQIYSGNFILEENQRLQGRANDSFKNNMGVLDAIGQAGLAGASGIVDTANKSITDQILNSDKLSEKSVIDAQTRAKGQKHANDKLTGMVMGAVEEGQRMQIILQQLAIDQLPHFQDAIQNTIDFITEKIGDAQDMIGPARNPAGIKPLDNLGSDLSKIGVLTMLAGLLTGVGSVVAAPFTAGASLAGLVPAAQLMGGGATLTGGGALFNAAGFSNGGVATGPRSGHLELLHGPEAVVPLPDGNTIPVSLGGGLDDLTTKLDTLTRLIGTDYASKTNVPGSDLTKLMDSVHQALLQQMDVQSNMATHTRESRDLIQKLLNVSM